MGHHYVPQFYLRAFSDKSSIWAYDKSARRHFKTNVKAIANENGMYSEELENRLAGTVEDPANPVLAKINRRLVIDSEERSRLANYIVVMWKRVPRARERVMDILPKAALDVGDRLNRELDELEQQMPGSSHKIADLKRRVDESLKEQIENPAAELWHGNVESSSSPRVVEALLSMNWTFLYSERMQYLTSDNPVFFFEEEGIGRPTSELSFPVSSSVTLVANRGASRGMQFIPANPQVVRALNRRTATNSTRFVYACRDESWIPPFVTKLASAHTRINFHERTGVPGTV